MCMPENKFKFHSVKKKKKKKLDVIIIKAFLLLQIAMVVVFPAPRTVLGTY